MGGILRLAIEDLQVHNASTNYNIFININMSEFLAVNHKVFLNILETNILIFLPNNFLCN